MFSQAEEDVDARSNWVGCWGILSEVRYGLTLDGVLLVVQGEDDLGDMLKLLDWASGGRRLSPTKNMNCRSGQNWTVLRWMVHLVKLQERKQK